jgi:alkylation response protein AidB-like acyl-CoA dehydrogenase
MDFHFTQEEEAFKKNFLSWLQENIPKQLLEYKIPESFDERVALYRDFQGKLFKAGYAGITYPKKYGGRGGTFVENIIVTEALAPWNATMETVNMVGFGMAGPTILTCGTEEQKERFLPKLLNGEHIWCQGFSEPNAGSDLGSLTTSAVRDGDDYIINGQKTWTTMAHKANFGICVARTDPKAAKHKGLSFFLVDMTTPGITVRPLQQISGEAEFNEVYFDDVRVPASMMVGKEGDGWRVILTLLEFERVLGDVSRASTYFWQCQGITSMARKVMKDGKPASKDPVIRQKLAQCFVDLMVVRLVGYRSVSKISKGQTPGPEGSLGKLYWSEVAQRLSELAMEIEGPYSQVVGNNPYTVDQGYWQHEYLFAKSLTIAGGTTQVQKNIISERVLDLPKDTARSIIQDKGR